MSARQRRFPAPLAPSRPARWRPAWTTNRRYTRSVVGLLFPPSTSLPASRPPVGSRQQQQQQARRLAGDLGTRTPPGRRHSPPSSHLRAARRPSRPQSGPLRAFRTQRWTPGYPPETRECPSTPFPSAAGAAAIRHGRAPCATSNINPSRAFRWRRGSSQRSTASLTQRSKHAPPLDHLRGQFSA